MNEMIISEYKVSCHNSCMNDRIFDSTVQAFGEEKVVRNTDIKKLPRRSFLEILTRLFQGYEIYSLGKKMGFIENPSKQIEAYQDYIMQWDLEWGGHVRRSFGNLIRAIIENKSSNESSKHDTKEILNAWIMFHSLEIMFRNKNAPLAMQGLDKYLNEQFIDASENREFPWCMTDDKEVGASFSYEFESNYAEFASYMMAGAIYTVDDGKPNIFHKDDNLMTLFYRDVKYNINCQDVESDRERIGAGLNDINDNIRGLGHVDFNHSFGFGSGSHFQHSLAILLGKRSNWRLNLVNSESDFITGSALSPNLLSLTIDASKIDSLSFSSEFSSRTKPLEDLPVFKDEIYSAVNYVMGKISFGKYDNYKNEEWFDDFSIALQDLKNGGIASLIENDFLKRSPFDSSVDAGETSIPDNRLLYFTNKVLELMEECGLATPLAITGVFCPEGAYYAKLGYTQDDGKPIQYRYDYQLYRTSKENPGTT